MVPQAPFGGAERGPGREGSAQIYPPIAWAPGTRSYLPSPAWGGWPGWRGRDAAWTLGVSRAGSPKPHQVGDSREGSQERPCRPAAGCLSLSYTMSDGEGPSAGEWQRYIYPPQVRLQSQGHRLQGALPPSPGCRQLWGWIPCLLA